MSPSLFAENQDSSYAGWLSLAVLLLVQCAWVLSLPVFPSQDGPAHVYYAKVARDLLLGHSTYANDYRIARPFPPYSVHAYLLMAARGWISGETSEKLLACLTVLIGVTGFGYLARQLGRNASVVSCLVAPFLLNRFLFLGFYGYEISVGVALLAMAMWLRDDRRLTRRRAAFLLLTFATLFSHPVPYLIVIAFCWSDVLAGWWSRAADSPHLNVPTWGDASVVTAATALFLYVKHYSHSGMLWNYELLADVHDKLMRVVDVFRTSAELPLKASVYNWVVAAALALVTVIVCMRAVRQGRSGAITRMQLVAGWAFLILIALPFLPRTMNGSGFFADRFSIWPPLLLFAAAANVDLSARQKRIALVAAAALLAFSIGTLDAHIRPVARKIDVSSISAPELAGLHLRWRNESMVPPDLTFDPYILSEIRLVDLADAILVNAPWMDLQIMMLEEVKNVPTISGSAIEQCNGSFEDSGEATLRRHPGLWRLRRYGCFEVLEPLRQR